MKKGSSWHSDRVDRTITLRRWGHGGTPVLLLPTAGGDAEEAERMGTVGALWPMIESGRIRVYSCDSLAGQALTEKRGSEEHRFWLLNRYQDTVAHEIVPAIHTDCGQAMDVIAAGASIGAFQAVALTCRYPWFFRAALAMSGTFDLEKLFGFRGNTDFYFASPLLFLPNLGESHQLERLRSRYVLLACGQGRWEDPDESWRMAGVLGAKGVPNRVDPWGHEWDHDWATWREMLPRYLNELA